MQIEKKSLSFITKEHPWRPISEEYVKILAEKIDRIGYKPKPLEVTPDGVLYGGRHRLRALQQLGIEEAWMHLHDPRPEKSLDQAAKESNEADSEALPETFVDHAEAVWRKLENQTQQEVADDLGWSRSMVAQYSRLGKIYDEAWLIVTDKVKADVLQSSSAVTEVVTGVTFTEGLLRDIVALTDEQQLDLVSELSKGKYDKRRFKKMAARYTARNEATAHVRASLEECKASLVDEAVEEVRSGRYDREYIKHDGPGPQLKNLVRGTREEHQKQSLVSIYHADFRDIYRDVLEPDSVDLIFTDPPYDRGSLPLYEALAEMAAYALKPAGSLIAYSGHGCLPEVLDALGKHLTYHWTCAISHNGGDTHLPLYGIYNGWKPLFWYTKGRRTHAEAGTMVRDFVSEGKKEKDSHVWQQSSAEAAYYIEKLVGKGALVVDPFAGSGTTLWAAHSLKRKAIGFEVDVEHYEGMQQKLSEL